MERILHTHEPSTATIGVSGISTAVLKRFLGELLENPRVRVEGVVIYLDMGGDDFSFVESPCLIDLVSRIPRIQVDLTHATAALGVVRSTWSMDRQLDDRWCIQLELKSDAITLHRHELIRLHELEQLAHGNPFYLVAHLNPAQTTLLVRLLLGDLEYFEHDRDSDHPVVIAARDLLGTIQDDTVMLPINVSSSELGEEMFTDPGLGARIQDSLRAPDHARLDEEVVDELGQLMVIRRFVWGERTWAQRVVLVGMAIATLVGGCRLLLG